MTCAEATRNIPLYLYGELDFLEEETLDAHLDQCRPCRAELEKQRAVLRALDSHEWQPGPQLLDACRRELHSRAASVAAERRSIRVRLLDWARSELPVMWTWRPLFAMALLAVGFFGGRLFDVAARGFEPSLLRVRDLTRNPGGGVRLVLEEVRVKTLTGPVDDSRIKGMLLAAANDPANPGLRARTLDILKDRCQQTDVRHTLLHALREDPNPGVRLKAIEGLKPFAREPEIRRVLSQVLLADENPGVRTMAVDLLVEDMQTEVIGTLQELILRENNPYIRQKSLNALREVNASLETF
ncbi:MAG: HEAT repeat domain-containing protein [Bryobacterales bacterium]|nr:HEAT repeat domain-containing protein [Bryobacterales bacterium]